MWDFHLSYCEAGFAERDRRDLPEARYTCGEFEALWDRLASRLAGSGIAKGTPPVAVLARNSRTPSRRCASRSRGDR